MLSLISGANYFRSSTFLRDCMSKGIGTFCTSL